MNVHSGKIEVRDDPLILGTEPIPAKYYYDPDWYELERKAVFMRSWLNVGHVCELPETGSFVRRDIEFANASLLIVRGKDGEIRTMHNVCTHRGTQLVDEESGKRPTFNTNRAALYSTLKSTVSLACNVPLITPSDPGKSALLLIVTGKCSLFRMPPECSTPPCIPESDIQTISAWVSQGAKGP